MTPPSAPLGLTCNTAHEYSWNDGHETRSGIPSVTTIIGILDKPGLVGWAKRVTSESAVRNLETLVKMRETGGDAATIDWLKRIPGYERDVAADLGTSVHRLAEQINRGVEPIVSADEAPFVHAYLKFVSDYRPRFLAVEEMICSLRFDYCGTLDGLAVIDGEPWLIDIKTGKSLYAETALQLSAYGAASFIGRSGTARRFRLPRVTRYGVIHVRPEGARLVEYLCTRETFMAFIEARRLYAWRKGAAKSVIGATVEPKRRTDAA